MRKACARPSGEGWTAYLSVMPHCSPSAEELLEARRVFGGGDDEDLADAGEQQDRERVVDHRLVVDGQELLADRLGDWMEPGAGAAGENDSLHRAPSAETAASRPA